MVSDTLHDYFVKMTDKLRVCNLLQCKHIRLYEDGQLSDEFNYLDNHLNGLCHKWYINGQLACECNYVHGKPHGLYCSWYDNGQLSVESNHVHGKLHGLHRSWHSNGIIRGHYIYSRDETTCKNLEKIIQCIIISLTLCILQSVRQLI